MKKRRHPHIKSTLNQVDLSLLVNTRLFGYSAMLTGERLLLLLKSLRLIESFHHPKNSIVSIRSFELSLPNTAEVILKYTRHRRRVYDCSLLVTATIRQQYLKPMIMDLFDPTSRSQQKEPPESFSIQECLDELYSIVEEKISELEAE